MAAAQVALQGELCLSSLWEGMIMQWASEARMCSENAGAKMRRAAAVYLTSMYPHTMYDSYVASSSGGSAAARGFCCCWHTLALTVFAMA